MNLRNRIIKHEGLRLKPYRDSVGKLTIGVGRNLDDVGISEHEAMMLLDSDLARAFNDAASIPVYKTLDPVRKDVLVEMVFNMGLPRVLEFKKFLAALAAKDWARARDEMLSSKWASQVCKRAIELSDQILAGTLD